MIAWQYVGAGWRDEWRAETPAGRVWISRHPRANRGAYVVWVGADRIGERNTLELARWMAENTIEGRLG